MEFINHSNDNITRTFFSGADHFYCALTVNVMQQRMPLCDSDPALWYSWTLLNGPFGNKGDPIWAADHFNPG
jgi:hypothetical protein